MDALLMLHEALCLALGLTVFTRSVRMDHRVRTDVRLVFWFMGLVAWLGMPAPLAWGVVPTCFSVLLLAVMVLVQLVTSRYWGSGVPRGFYKPECAPRSRADDLAAASPKVGSPC